jgi:hypothetical protein
LSGSQPTAGKAIEFIADAELAEGLRNPCTLNSGNRRAGTTTGQPTVNPL